MDRLTCMKSFARTVETGNFSAVARKLNTTQPTISKQMAALEEHPGVRLLTRSTHHLSLTDDSERFYEHCQRVLETAEEAQAAGNLRLNCSVSFGQLQIVPRLHWFNEWQFANSKRQIIKVKVAGRFRADSSAAIREATLAGIGISIAPIWLYSDDIENGKLQVLLRDYEPPPSPNSCDLSQSALSISKSA